jgi:alkyl hydroperoxide reductase subunit D
MTLPEIRESLKDYARDIKLNLSSVLTEEGASDLTQEQIWAVALACAYATRQITLAEAILSEAQTKISPETVEACKAAATIMGLNNVYYRFTHLAEDPEYRNLPARLRMNVIGKPGIAKADFELLCLAISAIAGCGACVNAHIAEVKKAGLTNQAVQSAVRIASTINATAVAITIG